MHPGDVVAWGTLTDVPDVVQLATGAWNTHEIARRTFAPDEKPVASKFYIEAGKSCAFATSILSERRKVRGDVIQESSLPWLGIWWCHNAWGDGRPHSTIGIEPTNIPSDGPVLTVDSTANKAEKAAKFTVSLTKLQ